MNAKVVIEKIIEFQNSDNQNIYELIFEFLALQKELDAKLAEQAGDPNLADQIRNN